MLHSSHTLQSRCNLYEMIVKEPKNLTYMMQFNCASCFPLNRTVLRNLACKLLFTEAALTNPTLENERDVHWNRLRKDGQDSHPQKYSKPGWMGIWATWSSERYPCPWQGSWNRWSLKPVPTQTNLWFYVIPCWLAVKFILQQAIN